MDEVHTKEIPISVSELIGKMVHRRESSAILMQLIEKELCDCVELDFSNVQHIIS
jgi:hypothetical protein